MAASLTHIEARVPDGTIDTVLKIENASQDTVRIESLPRPEGQNIFTVWAKADSTARVLIFAHGKMAVEDLGVVWRRIVISVENPTNVYIDFLPVRDTAIYLYKAMTEVASKESDWVPAQEDTDEAVATAQTTAQAAMDKANANATNMAEQITRINSDISAIQDQIDGAIEAHYYSGAPTTSNLPASAWTDEETRKSHEGDTYTDLDSGKSYRWIKKNNVWQWVAIADTDVALALEQSREALDIVNDHRRRIFYAQPTPPYDQGDLWVQGSNGDILRCQTAKTATQSYNRSDWVLASKYTDDTLAQTALDTAQAAEAAAAENARVIREEVKIELDRLQNAILLSATKEELNVAVGELQTTTQTAQDTADQARDAASANAQTITRLDSRLQTAELKITDSAITNLVENMTVVTTLQGDVSDNTAAILQAQRDIQTAGDAAGDALDAAETAQSIAETARQAASENASNIQSIEERVERAEMEITSTSIVSKVTSSEQFKAVASLASDNDEAIRSVREEAEAALQAAQDAEASLQEQLANLRIGSRNYIRNSRTMVLEGVHGFVARDNTPVVGGAIVGGSFVV